MDDREEMRSNYPARKRGASFGGKDLTMMP
jgi:hypothetical protein